MKIKFLVTTAVLFLSELGLAQSPGLGTLKVTIHGIKEVKGKLQVGLEKEAEDFDKGELSVAKYRGVIVEVTGETMSVEFKDLPFGTYAIKSFHDTNADGKLNTNLVGIPKEDYGFSNNVRGTMGPAKFKEAAFVFDSPEKGLSITLK